MNFKKQLIVDGKTITIVSLKEIEAAGLGKMSRLPFSISCAVGKSGTEYGRGNYY